VGKPIVVIAGGAYQGGVGDVVIIDMDDFDCESVDGKTEDIYHLIRAMEDNNLLDEDDKREPVMKMLDKLMDELVSLL
jgi:hypothetical protein